MKLLRAESYKKGIVSSIALNVVAKGLAFVNSMAVAFYFGAQSKTDVYFYCYAAVSLLVGFIGSLDSSVLIPEAMRIREQESAKKSTEFLNFFLYLYSGIGLLIVLILSINPVGFLSPVSNFSKSVLIDNSDLIFWFVPICVLMLLTNYLSNVLSSYKYFTVPIIAGIINNIFSVIFLVCFHGSMDVKSMALGLCSGYAVNISMLLLLMKTQLKWQFGFARIRFDIRLKMNIRYALSGNITSFLSGYAPFYFMSNFNTGLVTMYNYAKNLCEIPNQMIATQFSAVSGIKFNEVSAKNDALKLNDLFIQSTGILIFIMTPLCGVLFLFSEGIISLLYYRGAFDIIAVKQTAFILKYLSFTGIYFVINTMVSRLFMATQKLRESFWYQIYMNILFIVILGASSYYYGISGFVFGTFLYQLCVIIFTYWLMKKYFQYISYLNILKGIFVNVSFNLILILGFSLLFTKVRLTPATTILFACLYMLCVLFINQGLGMNKMFKEQFNYLFKRVMAVAFPNHSVQRHNPNL